MLNSINIKNFTIIENLELEMPHGMTAFTGETGAGKSIIIDAIEIALGKRSRNDIVKNDTDKADITLHFDISNINKAKEILKNYDLLYADACIIRRTIKKDGKSKIYINNTPSTSQPLRDLRDVLINIYGQHEFHNLLDSTWQREILDDYADNNFLVFELNKIFKLWQEKKIALDNIVNNENINIAKIEILTHQINELDNLNLQENEYEKLNFEHQQLVNAEKLLTSISSALKNIDNDEEISTLRLINDSLQTLHYVKHFHEKINTAFELINTAKININEAKYELKNYLTHTEINPEKLEFIENRLGKVFVVAQKHKIPAENLFSLKNKFQNELTQLDSTSEQKSTLTKEIINLEKEYFAYANELSLKRKNTAEILNKKITENINKLAIFGGEFKIDFEMSAPYTLQQHGLEKINFLVRTNQDGQLYPLSKIASGGELSRISLAVQMVIANKSITPTIIFDEVDVGIGGATADIIGKTLKELGQKAQVICITHLPQVAAQSSHHILT